MQKNIIKEIVLSLSEGRRIFSGKEVGMLARKQHNLNTLDKQDGIVRIKIEANIVNSSFILGMFSQSVLTLGAKGFFDKYEFDAPSNVLENIEVNVKYAASDNTAID